MYTYTKKDKVEFLELNIPGLQGPTFFLESPDAKGLMSGLRT